MNLALWLLLVTTAVGTGWALALSIDGARRAIGTRVRLARHRARTRPLPLVVRARTDLTDALFAVELAHPSGRRLPRAKPGQYVTLLVRDAGRPPQRRAYSIANATRRARHYELVIKRESSGSISPRLHARLTPGQTIDALPPRGTFTPRSPRSRSVVLIAAGVGITPLKAMAERLVPQGRRVLLVHVARTAQELFGFDQFTALALRYPRFTHAPHLTRALIAWPGHTGRPNPAWINAHSGPHGIERADVYLCGPDAMMQQMIDGLRPFGLDDERCFREDFGSAIVVPATDDDQVVPHRISIDGREPATWRGEPTLLHCLERAGAPELRDCGAGHCGSCVVRLCQGSVQEIRPGEWPLRAGEVLACCVRPKSDLHLSRAETPWVI
jgi:uncharacterized protein